jgi:hypothetical protein
MDDSKGKPSNSFNGNSNRKQAEDFNDSHEPHGMTLNRPFGEKNGVAEESHISIEYHLTARLTNSSLSRKELSLLLDVLNFQACSFGVNLNMEIAMYELYFRLLGNKTQSKEIRENHIRLTLTVSELILKNPKGCDFSLYAGEVFTLNPKLVDLLRPGLMSKRTYGSRYRTWRPEKFIKICAVPVDIQFLKRNDNSEPYSSYCKGYGESHPAAHRKKLKPTAELFGSGQDPYELEELKLFERCTDPVHVLSEFLLIKYQWFEKEK